MKEEQQQPEIRSHASVRIDRSEACCFVHKVSTILDGSLESDRTSSLVGYRLEMVNLKSIKVILKGEGEE